MTPLAARFWILGSATLLAMGTCAAPSQAQNYGFNTRFTYRPAFPVPYNFYSYQYLTLSGVNSNGPYQFSRYSFSNSPFPNFNNYGNYNNYGTNNYGSYAPSSSSMSGGYSSYPDAPNPLIERQRNALKNAQDNAMRIAPAGEAKTDFDDWLSQQADRRNAANPDRPALEIALINPTEGQLLSGTALNELAGRVSALESKGKKAAAGLCGPDLIGKIAFAGGPAAEAMNRFRPAKLAYPEVLKRPDFDALVEAFDKAYAPIIAGVQEGKKAAPADIDRLLDVIGKAKPMTEPALKDTPIADASALLAFYSSLEAATKYLRRPEAPGAIGHKWNTAGVNIGDLVRHMQKYQVHFGRAAAGDDAAYGSLHRGLLAYYAALSQAK